MRVRDALRRAVIQTNPYWPFSSLNKLPYRAAIQSFVRACREYPEIKSVYLKSSLAERRWVPGLSDIDLTVIIDSRLTIESEFAFLQAFWKNFAALKRLFPMYGEIDILNDQHIRSWTKFGLAGYSARNWKLIYGVESVAYNYRSDSRQFSLDCLNNATYFVHWYQRSHFGKKFVDQPESSFLLSHDLNRIAAKIMRCLEPFGLVNSRYETPDDTFCDVVMKLERAISSFEAVEKTAVADLDASWVEVFAGGYNEDVQIDGLGIRSSGARIEAVKSITSDFNNRIYIIFENGLDASTLKNCVDDARRTLGPRSASMYAVSVRVFEYMVRYYEPFDYVHFLRHRKVFFGEDLILQIPPPPPSAFVDFLLNQIRNALAYPQSRSFHDLLKQRDVATGELASTLERGLWLKLYLEESQVMPLPDKLRSHVEQHYPKYFAALRAFKETRGEESAFQLFTLLRTLTNDIHNNCAVGPRGRVEQ